MRNVVFDEPKPGTDTGRPTLRSLAGDGKTDGDDKPAKPDQDERPTLKRRE